MASIIGHRIKELRLAHNLTQEQLGQILGVNKSAIQKYEAGDVKNLKRDTIKTICNHFRVYPYQFVFEDGEYWAENEFVETVESQLKVNISHSRSEIDRNIVFLRKLYSLNHDGYDKIIAYMDDLAHIEKYKRKP